MTPAPGALPKASQVTPRAPAGDRDYDRGRDPLLPQSAGTDKRGVALALLVHLGLLAALTVSVDWRASPPSTVSAELWSAVPQAAGPKGVSTPAPPPPDPGPPPEPAPPPPPPPPAPLPPPAPPPPPPPEVTPPVPALPPVAVVKPPAASPTLDAAKAADIALEQQRRKKEAEAKARAADDKRQRDRLLAKQAAEKQAEQDAEAAAEKKKAQQQREQQQLAKQQEKLRADRLAQERQAKVDRDEKAEKERAARAEADASQKRLAAQRKENLERMLGQAGSATGGSGTAAQSSGPSAAYGSKLAALIRSNSVFTGTISGNPPAIVQVRTGPSGSILSRRLVKSSGHPEWDDAVLRAIDRTARLPADTDGRVPPVLTVEFRPNE